MKRIYLIAFAAFTLSLCAGSAIANKPVAEETIVVPSEANDSVESEAGSTEVVTDEPNIIGFGKAGIAYLKKTFTRDVYFGECPGRANIGYFNSQKLLVSKSDESVPEPAEGIRVRILNQNNSAYSDRHWEPKDQDPLTNYYRSQGIDIDYGTSHSNRYFNLESGSNEITVAFYKEELGLDSEIARMNFSVDVDVEETRIERNRQYGPSSIECVANRKLSGNLITDENCPRTRERVRYLQCSSDSENGMQATRDVEDVLAGPKSRPIIVIPGIGGFEWPF